VSEQNFQMLAKTLFGLEGVLAKELKKLGAQDVTQVVRGVTFKGDIGFLYKANLWLRTAVRILMPITNFKVRGQDDLYKKMKAIPWEDYFDVDKTIVIDATAKDSFFRNTLFIAQLSKDAIADRFRENTGKRPSVSTREPDIRINLYIQKEKVVVSMDSSGDSLHKRGYRSSVDRAPINEVLAAGIIQLTDWDKYSPLIDPMCGSGTFPIEAALLANNIPPAVFRKHFCFKHWKNFDGDLYQLIFDKSLEKETPFEEPIMGFDKLTGVVRKAEQNVRNALMEEQISIGESDFFKQERPARAGRRGTLLFNPPYGIKIEANIPELYKKIGDALKQHWSGYTAYVFTSSLEGIKHIELRPSKKIKLYNGTLESYLLRYDLYEGSRKNKD
jgi:putative N6-adenine-specific DNA methylase